MNRDEWLTEVRTAPDARALLARLAEGVRVPLPVGEEGLDDLCSAEGAVAKMALRDEGFRIRLEYAVARAIESAEGAPTSRRNLPLLMALFRIAGELRIPGAGAAIVEWMSLHAAALDSEEGHALGRTALQGLALAQPPNSPEVTEFWLDLWRQGPSDWWAAVFSGLYHQDPGAAAKELPTLTQRAGPHVAILLEGMWRHEASRDALTEALREACARGERWGQKAADALAAHLASSGRGQASPGDPGLGTFDPFAETQDDGRWFLESTPDSVSEAGDDSENSAYAWVFVGGAERRDALVIPLAATAAAELQAPDHDGVWRWEAVRGDRDDAYVEARRPRVHKGVASEPPRPTAPSSLSLALDDPSEGEIPIDPDDPLLQACAGAPRSVAPDPSSDLGADPFDLPEPPGDRGSGQQEVRAAPAAMAPGPGADPDPDPDGDPNLDLDLHPAEPEDVEVGVGAADVVLSATAAPRAGVAEAFAAAVPTGSLVEAFSASSLPSGARPSARVSEDLP